MTSPGLNKKKIKAYNLDSKCIEWVKKEAKKQDRSESSMLNVLIKGLMVEVGLKSRERKGEG